MSSSPVPAVREAKRPVTVLAGPYGHPMHPMLIPVPIGAWVASFVFDLVSHGAGEEEVFAKGAFWLIALGIVGALAAALFGFLDLLAIPRGTRAFRTAVTHMALNLAVTALFAVSFLLRRDDLDEAAGGAALATSVVALALLAVSGWLGGKLSFHNGVRVADEQTQAEGYLDGQPSRP
jgi:uncharacterized membrane protein